MEGREVGINPVGAFGNAAASSTSNRDKTGFFRDETFGKFGEFFEVRVHLGAIFSTQLRLVSLNLGGDFARQTPIDDRAFGHRLQLLSSFELHELSLFAAWVLLLGNKEQVSTDKRCDSAEGCYDENWGNPEGPDNCEHNFQSIATAQC